MTITDLHKPETQEGLAPFNHDFDPYTMRLDGPEAQFLLDRLTKEMVPYADSTTNPDIGNRAIYAIDGSSKFSDLARALEADVYSKDWKQSVATTREEAVELEANSRFFLLTESGDDGTKVVGSLRIADCDRGKSETQEFYKSYFKTDVLPEEIALDEGREKVWDIVGVAVTNDPSKRTGLESAWLYFAMHKKSAEEGIKKWVSNITEEEIRNLRDFIGIPFEEISTKQKAHIYDDEGNVVKTLGFYSVDAPAVGPTVEKNIDRLEKGKGVKRFIAQIAMIGLWGSTTRPLLDSDKIAS
jgi:hypothetical protein